jgi:ParB-like chromosome segregation protein Spo0J
MSPTGTMRLVPIRDIRIPALRRRASDISQLVESIREHGLLNPITVTRDLVLIAGQHRLAAFQELAGC